MLRSAWVGGPRSELERNIRHLFVLLLRELVLEGCEELGIDLKDEALDVLNNSQQVLFLVFCSSLHLLVPDVDLLD